MKEMDKMIDIDKMGKIRFYPDLNEYSNIYKTYPKESQTKKQDSLEDIIKDYGLEKWWEERPVKKVEYTYTNISTVREAIRMFGFKAILLEFLKEHQPDEILEMLNIKDIQKFLRKKKMEELQKSI
jgi:hypothetical protein